MKGGRVGGHRPGSVCGCAVSANAGRDLGAAGAGCGGDPDAPDGQFELCLVHADAAGPQGPDEHVLGPGGARAVLRLSHCRVSLRCAVGF